jgi:putative cell wall-binding protein
MVSNKTIKEYDFKTIEDYYEYIAESIMNGQRKQAQELIKALSKPQRKEAYNYYNTSFGHFFGEAKQMIIKEL